MHMVARLQKNKQNTRQNMYPFNREVLIWGFELLLSSNRTHESSRSRGVYSSLQEYFVSYFSDENKKEIFA